MPESAYKSDSLRASPPGEARKDLRPRFTSYLDDYPDHLVPQRYIDTAIDPADTDGTLALNPNLLLARIEDLPVGIVNASLLDNFNPGEDMVWVRAPGEKVWHPFWLGPRLYEIVLDLMAGRQVPANLSPNVRWVLKVAHILINQAWQPNLRHDLAVQFKDKGYCPVTGLIHPFHLSALRMYYRKLLRGGFLRRGDDQSDRRYVAHNERAARLFHYQLTPAIAEIAGEPIKPSYVYVASYQSGAQLEKHTDREQCEFSVTLCVDYSPEPDLHTPWPLQLHTSQALVTVFQGLGDGLAYRGCEIPHSRDALADGHTSTSIFFHYVRSDFQGPLD